MRFVGVLYLASGLCCSAALAEPPEILSRADWGAAPAIEQRAEPIENRDKGTRRIAAENKMMPRETALYLTVHHTARRASDRPLSGTLKDFQTQMFSYRIDYGNGVQKNVYLGDLPYHYFIDAKGAVGEGRALDFAAYSNTRYRTPIAQHITVVLDGNFERTDPTSAQIEALVALLDHLSAEHDIPLENIGGHRDVAQTLCPGKNLAARMPAVIAAIRDRRK